MRADRYSVRLATGAGLMALAASLSPATAQLNEPLPQDLQGVGITQKLDAELPLELTFRNETGQPVVLSDLFDGERPVLLNLVYYECPMLCNLVLRGLLETLVEMEWSPGREFDIVTVSIDPTESPTTARQKKQQLMQTYARPQAAAGWHFLTGKKAQIQQLADAVGFHYRYVPDSGEYAHSAAHMVVTPDGRISRYLIGLQHEPRTVRLSLVEAGDGKIGSAVDRFLLYCYRYDETKGRYAPVARRLMRLGGGLTVVVLGAVLFSLWRRDGRRGVDSE